MWTHGHQLAPSPGGAQWTPISALTVSEPGPSPLLPTQIYCFSSLSPSPVGGCATILFDQYTPYYEVRRSFPSIIGWPCLAWPPLAHVPIWCHPSTSSRCLLHSLLPKVMGACLPQALIYAAPSTKRSLKVTSLGEVFPDPLRAGQITPAQLMMTMSESSLWTWSLCPFCGRLNKVCFSR